MSGQAFTNADLAKCARREVGLRKRAYPRWIDRGTITAEKAEREIAMMTVIADQLERLAEADKQAQAPTLL
jgi:hypothetical protein